MPVGKKAACRFTVPCSMSFCTIERFRVRGFRMHRMSHGLDAHLLPFNREKITGTPRFGRLVLPVAARYADCSHGADLNLFRDFVLPYPERSGNHRAAAHVARVSG